MLKPRSITKMFLIVTVLIAVFLGLSTAVISILSQYNSFQKAAHYCEDAYMTTQKDLLRNEVITFLGHIAYEKSLAEKRLRIEIRNQVQEVHAMAMAVCEKHEMLRNDREIQGVIADMVSLRRHHGKESFWIISPGQGFVFHPLVRENASEPLPENLREIFRDTVNALSDGKDAAFYEHYLTRPGHHIPLRTISYAKRFRPYDWIIGADMCLADSESDVQKEALGHLEHVTFGTEGQIQMLTFDGTVLADPSQSFSAGENILEATDANGLKIVQQILEAGLNPEGGYVSYAWKKDRDTEPRTKLVFAKAVYDWGWIITAGMFADDIDTVTAAHREVLRSSVMQQIGWMLSLFLLVIFSGILAAYIFSRRLRNEFQVFISFFENAADTYTPIDKQKLSSREFRILADHANDMRDEIVRSRHELSESEKRYRTLVETIPHGIQEVDVNGTMTFINSAYHKMYGYAYEELIGTSMAEVLSTDAQKEALRSYLEMLLEKQPPPVPYFGRVSKKDGSIMDVQADWQYKRDEQGNITGFISVISDITERKQAREKIQELNRTLEQKVRERTRELHETIRRLEREIAQRERTESELQHAKEAAESANRAKSAFLANMSHELRTPLNAILGFAQVMAHSRISDPEQQENLAIIRRSGEHLLTLINQVLDLSKIEAGHITRDENDFDLHSLLCELEEMFRIQARQKALNLAFHCSEEVPRYIRTDEVRLRQVLINLLNNALKFTPEGRVTLSIRVADTRDHSSDARRLRFEIADTGPGIAPEEQADLFEAFVQTETGRQAQEGSGLGLPISRKFVQLIGGDITVRSLPGQGTTFFFDIPAGIASSPGTSCSLANRRVIGLRPDQPRYRILIADDRQDNRKLIVRMLNPFGFDLREACNGQETLEIWETWRPHLIWMDIRMPVMSGYEAARRIREAERNLNDSQGTAIIAISANAYEEERAVAISEGCDDFLRKPFQEVAFFDMMARYSGIRFEWEEAEATPLRKQAAACEAVLTPEAIQALPDDICTDFQRALLIADFGMAMRLTEAIRPEHPALADALTDLLSDFRFDMLQELFGKGE